jgi:hypothetical protein
VIGYDTSTYRIDNVRLWPIRVLFFAAMLLGAYARQQRGLFVGRLRLRHVVAVGVALPVYLISKLAFTRYPSLAPFQLVNWGALLVALAAIMRLMLGMEDRLARLPVAAISVVSSIARVTLEIYLVQYSLIPLLEGLGPFPLNFAVVCTGIGVSAYALHQIVDRRDSIVLRLWSRRRGAGAC